MAVNPRPSASRDRNEGGQTGARLQQRGDPTGSRVVARECTAEQRAPREVDRELIRDREEFLWGLLRRRDHEERVRDTATPGLPGRPPRGLGHRRRARVDSNDESTGLGPCPRHDRPSVAGTQVDDDPVRSGDPLSELADVHLGEAAARHRTHSRNLTLRR